MPEAANIPEPFARYVEPYYVEPFGEMPPVPGERLETAAEVAPEVNLRAEEARASALFSDVFDKKTAQLIALAILAGGGSPGTYWHALAARRYGASWDELNKAVEIATFFKGFGALMDGGRALGRLWKEEKAAE